MPAAAEESYGEVVYFSRPEAVSQAGRNRLAAHLGPAVARKLIVLGACPCCLSVHRHAGLADCDQIDECLGALIEYTGCTQGRAGCTGHAQDIKVCADVRADVVGTQDGGATDRAEGESEALKLRNDTEQRNDQTSHHDLHITVLSLFVDHADSLRAVLL